MLIKLLLLASQCLGALRQVPRFCAKLALAGALVLAVGGCASGLSGACEGDLAIKIDASERVQDALPAPVIINGLGKDRKVVRMYSSEVGDLSEENAAYMISQAGMQRKLIENLPSAENYEGGDFRLLFLAAVVLKADRCSADVEMIADNDQEQLWIVKNYCSSLLSSVLSDYSEFSEDKAYIDVEKLVRGTYVATVQKVSHRCKPALYFDGDKIKEYT